MTAVARKPPTVEFDEYGLLRDPATWSEDLARDIARQLGIGELTEGHWQVIRTLRDYYARFGVAPAMRHVCRTLGQDRHWVHELFQTCLNAWCVSGLPNPGEEAKAYMSGN